MNKTLLLLFGIISFGAYSQIEISNTQYSFGGSFQDGMRDVLKVSDGYLLLMNSSSGISGNKTEAGFGGEDYWLVKTDFNLSIQWQKVYGGNLQDTPFNILELSDGNYLLSGGSFSGVSGNKTSTNHGDEDFYCVKVDNSGNIIWDVSFGGDSTDVALSAIEINNEIYLTGQTFSDISGNKSSALRASSDCWIVKFDLNGNKIWDKTYGGDEYENMTSITSIDNKIYVACHTNSNAGLDKTSANFGENDIWIITLDTAGNLINQSSFGGDDFETNPYLINNGTSLLLASSSLSDVTGNKSSTSFGSSDYWLLKLDTSYNVLMDKSYGGDDSDECYGISEMLGGDYIIYGRSRSNASGLKNSDNFDQVGIPVPKYDIWFLGINSVGDTLWQSTFGGTNNDNPTKIIEDPNHTLNIFSQSSSNPDGNKTSTQYGSGDGWVIKLETNLSIEEQEIEELFSVYPNPTNGVLNIKFENNNEDFEVLLYNSIGQLKNQFELQGGHNTINLNNTENGVYFLEIHLKSKVISKRIVITNS